MEEVTVKDYFEGLLHTVDSEIQTIELNEPDFLHVCKRTIDYLQDVMSELKSFTLNYSFSDNSEEINFFKHLKPQIVCKLIYYNSIYSIELKRPTGSDDVLQQYYCSELDLLTIFFNQNLTFYQYYRTNASYLDDKYFLRGKRDIQIIVDNSCFEADPQFSTSYDFKVAKILANELLKIFLTERMQELNKETLLKRIQRSPLDCGLTWTGKKAALVEIIYALETSGNFNKGNTDVKTIAACFEASFNVDLGDFYHIYMELKGRKINRTRYLDILQKNLIRRMEEED